MSAEPKTLLFYATRDGQARRIAAKIAETLGERKIVSTPRDLRDGEPSADELSSASMVVLVAAVRYGRHLEEAERFLSFYDTLPSPPPLALASINLTARKPGKDTAEGNAYLRKWIARHQCRPAVAAAIAGRLDYPRYGWFDRQMIRLIMKITGGPTDPRTQVEFTSWEAVERFAEAIAGVRGRRC